MHMHQGKYVFSQIMNVVRRYDFNQCVDRYHGEFLGQEFLLLGTISSTHFRTTFFSRKFARYKRMSSERIVKKLYHLGFRSSLIRTTLAYANEHRDWRIYRDYAELLIKEAKALYANDASFNHELDETVYVLDSTTVELCLALFSWARIGAERATLKLHLGLNLKGNIPAFFHISDGKYSDVEYMDSLEYGSWSVLCHGSRLYRFHSSVSHSWSKSVFVTRSRKDIRWHRLYSNPVDKQKGIRCDQTIRLSTHDGRKHYPEKFRRIKYFDAGTKRTYVFFTNDFSSSAMTIAELYKNRWQVELFFKWIKQHLSIKVFWGRSLNAVKTQICIALCAYLLVAIMKKKLKIEKEFLRNSTNTQRISFDKMPMVTLISEFVLQELEASTENSVDCWIFNWTRVGRPSPNPFLSSPLRRGS